MSLRNCWNIFCREFSLCIIPSLMRQIVENLQFLPLYIFFISYRIWTEVKLKKVKAYITILTVQASSNLFRAINHRGDSWKSINPIARGEATRLRNTKYVCQSLLIMHFELEISKLFWAYDSIDCLYLYNLLSEKCN